MNGNAKITPINLGDGKFWYILQRPGGSVCLYWIQTGTAAHFVVFDSLDPSPVGTDVLLALCERHDALTVLLSAIERSG